ncbi:carboxylating nicotinate-nucleotide diphosphorylase [Weeksella virosa]|uniref:Probable nicotinate-nucleotide pyrophosphorylase [carboxylating] n=1 Tax=Weeksella virosa (strain ATCC 43766 / DSM 16922 / JCM 21250 / CCUG 30538 / CDC 9751 / IAM 14551 / NBRC 16016 / NCTC 11634 / CL345/78) TaxID=865938 RepID=F0P1A4_WEEVC|nr:carboxylating nicotinate-nucleotide diphosphorylase [Weeksella virosa]ADX67603.1 nicotinate-nucleotide pyrophosphorylase [Weeksella virosa DSM 16922]VEH64773.1 Probable nicotinate-nucleotide pyrophosphorylase [carboxylating] [Weeksella virosa]
MNLPSYITLEKIDTFIEAALHEDVGDGDHSSLACIPKDAIQTAELLVKDNGVLAGIELAKYIFSKTIPNAELIAYKKDGDWVEKGEIALEIKGNAQKILTTERLVLNCMQRMSGIATYAHEMMQLIAHTTTKILDTRKTTPNFRMLEKWAVKIGGAENHRFGLYDMVMLKDNHIDFCGSIMQAVHQTKKYLQENQLDLKIEVETRNLEEVQEALEAKVDCIMLDNFSLPDLRKAVQLIDNRVTTEASGSITKESVRAIAETGVDFISSGAIIHSARNFDLSLKAKTVF